MNVQHPPILLPVPELARTAGLDEGAIIARIERGQLYPDAFMRGAVPGSQPVPLFDVARLPEHVAALAVPVEN